MANQPTPTLTNELLNKLFYIGADRKLYRKMIEHLGFCSVTSWNSLAFYAKPIEVDYLSLKVAGLNTYKTRFICDAVRMGVENAYAKQKKIALRTAERNLDKAVKTQKVKHVDNPHNLKSAAKKTQDMAALNRGVAEIVKARRQEAKEVMQPKLSELLAKSKTNKAQVLAALKAGAYRV